MLNTLKMEAVTPHAKGGRASSAIPIDKSARSNNFSIM